MQHSVYADSVPKADTEPSAADLSISSLGLIWYDSLPFCFSLHINKTEIVFIMKLREINLSGKEYV